MRYDKDITKKISEELQKVPNVRYVCGKIGIDHSTFYRWMSKHHAFYQLVTTALSAGRDRMNDAAESVVISGIQRNEFKAASYWLSHNSPRYSSAEQTKYLWGINDNLIEIIGESLPEGPESTFELYFDAYESMQQVFGADGAEKRINKLVVLACGGDTELEKIFHLAYAEWKADKDNLERKFRDVQPPENP